LRSAINNKQLQTYLRFSESLMQIRKLGTHLLQNVLFLSQLSLLGLYMLLQKTGAFAEVFKLSLN